MMDFINDESNRLFNEIVAQRRKRYLNTDASQQEDDSNSSRDYRDLIELLKTEIHRVDPQSSEADDLAIIYSFIQRD